LQHIVATFKIVGSSYMDEREKKMKFRGAKNLF
jgi:hypothetical protein